MAARKKKAKKAVKKKSARGKKVPAAQGKSDVGYKSPPREYQFKPGESGNPKGAPIRRIDHSEIKTVRPKQRLSLR